MSDPAPPPRLLYCRCAYAQVLPQEVKDGVLRHLCAGGQAFESVADLCKQGLIAPEEGLIRAHNADTFKTLAGLGAGYKAPSVTAA